MRAHAHSDIAAPDGDVGGISEKRCAFHNPAAAVQPADAAIRQLDVLGAEK
jgi:hypothetical protein